MKELYFCVFSDYHYWPGSYPAGTDGLQTILRHAHDKGARCVAHCGDFAHNAPGMPEIVDLYVNNPYHLPAFGCIGNHEVERASSLEAVLACYKMQNNYVYNDIDGFRLITLDTNYYRAADGTLTHNPPLSHSAPGKPSDCLPPEQLAWLRETIFSSPYPCLLFSHASFESTAGCPQADEVRALIRQANELHPGRVLMCLNGHYHRNAITRIENVVYFDINAVYNAHWLWSEHNGYPPEFAAKARLIPHIFLFQDPLHAFVRVRADGAIDIEGMETTYQLGVSPESQGVDTTNRFGRAAEPRISSYHQEAFL